VRGLCMQQHGSDQFTVLLASATKDSDFSALLTKQTRRLAVSFMSLCFCGRAEPHINEAEDLLVQLDKKCSPWLS
jgi:hypothetical protein